MSTPSTPKPLIQVGARYGHLTVLRRGALAAEGCFWVVRCDCGNERSVKDLQIRHGRLRSCGCVGRLLTVKRPYPCACGCGRLITPRRLDLRGRFSKNRYASDACRARGKSKLASTSAQHRGGPRVRPTVTDPDIAAFLRQRLSAR